MTQKPGFRRSSSIHSRVRDDERRDAGVTEMHVLNVCSLASSHAC